MIVGEGDDYRTTVRTTLTPLPCCALPCSTAVTRLPPSEKPFRLEYREKPVLGLFFLPIYSPLHRYSPGTAGCFTGRGCSRVSGRLRQPLQPDRSPRTAEARSHTFAQYLARRTYTTNQLSKFTSISCFRPGRVSPDGREGSVRTCLRQSASP